MALPDNEKAEIKSIVKKSLDKAERVWKSHGEQLTKSLAYDESLVVRADSSESPEIVSSRIPRHPLVDGDHPQVADFIALVADMRQSSRHLLCTISEKVANVSLLQRVYYETSALLPALEMTLIYEGGSVTEYLGDGILAIFPVAEEDKSESIRKAYRSANNCLLDTRSIVNWELKNRYNLPDLNIGIGLSYSKALVQLVGLAGGRHPKVIGNCVYYASKLSGGNNEIYVDETIYNLWPKSKGGKLTFSRKGIRGTPGYLIDSK